MTWPLFKIVCFFDWLVRLPIVIQKWRHRWHYRAKMKPRIFSVICCLLYCFLEICIDAKYLSFVFLKRKVIRISGTSSGEMIFAGCNWSSCRKVAYKTSGFDGIRTHAPQTLVARPLQPTDLKAYVNLSPSLHASCSFAVQVTDTNLVFGRRGFKSLLRMKVDR